MPPPVSGGSIGGNASADAAVPRAPRGFGRKGVNGQACCARWAANVDITVELVEVRKDRCVARRRGGRGSNDAGGGRRNAEFGDRGPGKRKAGRCDAAKAEGHTTLKRHSSQARDTLMPGRGSRAPCAPLPPSGVDPPFFRYRFSSTLHDSFIQDTRAHVQEIRESHHVTKSGCGISFKKTGEFLVISVRSLWWASLLPRALFRFFSSSTTPALPLNLRV